MRIVVAFTRIHPLAHEALKKLAPDAELRSVDANVFAFSALVAELWRDGKDFLIVEHDIEVTRAGLNEAEWCPCEWSASVYRGANQGPLTQSLGFTRFRASLMAAVPDAVMRANAIDDSGSICPPGHWKLLDGRLLSVLRSEGYEPHTHVEVPHHHVYEGTCACRRDHEEE